MPASPNEFISPNASSRLQQVADSVRQTADSLPVGALHTAGQHLQSAAESLHSTTDGADAPEIQEASAAVNISLEKAANAITALAVGKKELHAYLDNIGMGSIYSSEDAPDNTASHPEAAPSDPFDVMRTESMRMFDEYPALNETDKAKRLDSFFKGIEMYDRKKYADMDGKVTYGVPNGYIPDGFRDMGTATSLVPSERYGRAMNYVDMYRTLRQHKQLFAFVFDTVNPKDFLHMPNGELAYQQTIVSNIAREISMTMPYGEPTVDERGGLLPISTAVPAVCQQQALVAQVLMQAFGIRSRISKNFLATNENIEKYDINIAGGDHVSNVVTMHDGTEDRLYMLDTTNPQLGKDGKWSFGFFRLKDKNDRGAWIVHEAQGGKRTYQEHGNMNWTVLRQE